MNILTKPLTNNCNSSKKSFNRSRKNSADAALTELVVA